MRNNESQHEKYLYKYALFREEIYILKKIIYVKLMLC